MKLVYIVNRIDGPGGLERVLSIKASRLADHYNYDVHVITLNQTEGELFYEFSPKLQYHNINVSGNPISYIYRYSSQLKQKIKEIKPDVIAVCDDGLKGLLLPFFIGKSCPIIYERHVSKNVELQQEKRSLKSRLVTKVKFKIMNYGGGLYDRFVVLTEGNKNEWDLKNLMVIPNPLSFYPDQRSTLQNKRVLAVGKHCFQKGFDRLLQSWKSIHENHPNWRLDIYGTIEPKEKLADLAEELGISESVHFFPPVKNIAEKYKESSIYAMSSRYEGFGMVLTEAMAYGVPCVSFDCPYGPSDIITHNRNGLLVENHDIVSFAKAISKLIADNEMRSSMGEDAKEAVKRYLPEKIASEWNDLFTSLTKSKVG